MLAGETEGLGSGTPGSCGTLPALNMVVIAVGAEESVAVFCEPIDTEFLVVGECQLTDHRAQRYLGRLDVHLVQNFFHFHHNLTVSEDDDGIGALIGDELGVSDRDGLRRGVYRLSGELLGNIQCAAAPHARARELPVWDVMGLFKYCRASSSLLLLRLRTRARQPATGLQRQRPQCPARSTPEPAPANVTGGNVLQIACDWFCKLNVGIKLLNQLTNERHVDWPCHDVDTVRAHVGSKFDFTNDDRFLG